MEEVVRFTVEPDGRDLGGRARSATASSWSRAGRSRCWCCAPISTTNLPLRRLHRQLDKMGVIKRLRELGAKHGDTVRIHGLEFEFTDEAYG